MVRTLAGSLSSQATGAVSASGNLLLQAGGATSDLNLAGTVASSGGHVSLAAGQDVLLNANVTASAAGKSVDVVAGRNFVQAQGTTLTAVDGNIGLQAVGGATLENFNAGVGQVRIAAASVVDGDTAANETEVDVTASALQLVTTGAVGSGSNALETSVQTLAAATGNLFLTETDALTLASLAVDTQRVGADGTATSTANATTTGVSGATTVVQTVAGTIDSLATAAVNASGNLLLKAGGGGSDLLLLGNVSGAGDLTLHGARATFDPGRSFVAWLIAITQRRTIDILRRQTRLRSREVHAPLAAETHVAEGNPEADATSTSEARQLRAAVAKLPEGQRQAVEALALEENSLEDASKRTGRTKSALKVNLHRAIKTLRARMGGVEADGEAQ